MAEENAAGLRLLLSFGVIPWADVATNVTVAGEHPTANGCWPDRFSLNVRSWLVSDGTNAGPRSCSMEGMLRR